VIAAATLLAASQASAQPMQGDDLLEIVGGFGLTQPRDVTSDSSGMGVYLAAEYAWAPVSFIGLRSSGGVLVTGDGQVSSELVLFGARARLALPIPWVAPYFELGVGFSLGSVRTRTTYEDEDVSGAFFHWPVELGLALGPDHQFAVAIMVFHHPELRQRHTAIVAGFTLQLDPDD
jgi:hypothetical protein